MSAASHHLKKLWYTNKANAQPSSPPPFHMPDDNELLSLVSSHISNMKFASSPGFDTINPSFIKCATKRVPRHNGRGQETVNVTAPHIAALFNMLMTQARVPRVCTEAKHTPIHKKRPVTNPGNYIMIAVSGTMYRLYANVLRFIIQEWCGQHNKVPDFQFGFFSGRSTLQPLFIIKTLERCSPKTTSKHITTVCCFHRLQADIQFHTQRQTVGTITSLSHASPSTIHPLLRLVLHR